MQKTSPNSAIQPEFMMAEWKTKGLYFIVRQEHKVSR